MSQDAIESSCAAHGVPRAALKKVFTLHDFKSDLVDPKEVIVLLLTCLAQVCIHFSVSTKPQHTWSELCLVNKFKNHWFPVYVAKCCELTP